MLTVFILHTQICSENYHDNIIKLTNKQNSSQFGQVFEKLAEWCYPLSLENYFLSKMDSFFKNEQVMFLWNV